MLYRLLMRCLGPLRLWLARLHWWCWRQAATRHLPPTTVRSLADQAALNVAARGDYAGKIHSQRAVIQPEGGPGPYTPATTWAQFEAQVRERAAAQLKEGSA